MKRFPKFPFKAEVRDAFGRPYIGTVVEKRTFFLNALRRNITEYRVVDSDGKNMPRYERDITPIL